MRSPSQGRHPKRTFHWLDAIALYVFRAKNQYWCGASGLMSLNSPCIEMMIRSD